MRMKTLRLLTLALFAVSTAAAQGNRGFGYEDEYSPTVYLISVNQPDMRSDCPCPAKEAAELNRLAASTTAKRTVRVSSRWRSRSSSSRPRTTSSRWHWADTSTCVRVTTSKAS